MAMQTDAPRAWHEWTPALFFLVPLGLMLTALFWSVDQDRGERVACLQSGKSLAVVTGTLRLASEKYFVVDGQWKFFTTGCNGKTATHCYATNPGIQALRDSVGAVVSVEFCDSYPVAYTVAGVRYAL